LAFSASILLALPVGVPLLGASRGIAATDETNLALRLAELLQAARTVISRNQDLINDPGKGDKGLTGDRVVSDTVAVYAERMGEDPRESDPDSLEGRLLRAQLDAIKAVVDENQASINAERVGFKGFIPATFARLVNEKFGEAVGTEAQIKVTAPENLVRNRKALPDDWEQSVLEHKFSSLDWPKGEPFSETVKVDGRPAFRIMVPEYYVPSCLSCHGGPAGEMDITGYPKEGGEEGDLGAAISITLFE
jgi:hypothetical protein